GVGVGYVVANNRVGELVDDIKGLRNVGFALWPEDTVPWSTRWCSDDICLRSEASVGLDAVDASNVCSEVGDNEELPCRVEKDLVRMGLVLAVVGTPLRHSICYRIPASNVALSVDGVSR